MNFEIERQRKVSEIEEIIKKYLPLEDCAQRTVIEAMNYSLMAGGKRLRPMLMEETFKLFGGKDISLLQPFMVAIEMIHTYSLVHDDLPCMDNDEYRRGRKTTHVVYGEAMALLAGDSLLNYAFEIAVSSCKSIVGHKEIEELDSYRRILKALDILAVKAGTKGMIGGQVIDMEEYKYPLDRNRLNMMYRLKTGALIEASMMIGAVIAGAVQEEIDKIEQIATDIGLAFQIKDDILDVTSSVEVLGKPVHSDEKNDKTTYVTMMDIHSAEKEVSDISERAVRAYEELPYQNDYLKALIIKLITRES
ncbi:MAG TPA: farnesyl diphosphate synthase [Mobilitalea sp.]|nr:farnesyl diphosphate synthase [Mobilitalea sp.]